HHGVHRARRQGQPGDAVLLPLAGLAGAQPRARALAQRLARARARRRLQGRHLGPARVAGREADRAAAAGGRAGRLPRPTRAVVRAGRALARLGAAAAAGLRRGRDRHGPLRRRLRGARPAGAPRRGPAQRDRTVRDRQREGPEAVTAPVRVGQVGLGPWGRNLLRNFDEAAVLAWICDTSEETLRSQAARYPEARATSALEDLLADEELDALVVATPVPTHYELARLALQAGKHVFVEKPPAMRAAEMEELLELARERERVLMPGHLLLYHPGVRKLKELIDSGELGEVLCVYGNRQNLGVIRSHENALWSLGVHDLSVILWLIDEEPVEAVAHGRDFLQPGVEDVVFCFLRFPSGKVAHMHLSWLDPHKMRKMTVVGKEKMAV